MAADEDQMAADDNMLDDEAMEWTRHLKNKLPYPHKLNYRTEQDICDLTRTWTTTDKTIIYKWTTEARAGGLKCERTAM